MSRSRHFHIQPWWTSMEPFAMIVWSIITTVVNLEVGACSKIFFAGGGRVGGLRTCHPPYHPLDFQGKIKNFCHPTLLKISFKIAVTPPPLPQKEQSQNYGASINSDGLLTLSGLLSLKEVPLLVILTRNISSNFSPEFLSICEYNSWKSCMLLTFEKSTFCKGLYGENDGPSI